MASSVSTEYLKVPNSCRGRHDDTNLKFVLTLRTIGDREHVDRSESTGICRSRAQSHNVRLGDEIGVSRPWGNPLRLGNRTAWTRSFSGLCRKAPWIHMSVVEVG
jgi:hypothetical protein